MAVELRRSGLLRFISIVLSVVAVALVGGCGAFAPSSHPMGAAPPEAYTLDAASTESPRTESRSSVATPAAATPPDLPEEKQSMGAAVPEYVRERRVHRPRDGPRQQGGNMISPAASGTTAGPRITEPGVAAVGEPNPAALEQYAVQVSATESMKLDREPGQLSIWIGIEGRAPSAEAGMATAESQLGVGNTALVTPFAPGFKLGPETPTCQLLDPTGTQVRYSLTPLARGHYEVGANVNLFASADCSGPAVPKATKLIQVSVTVAVADGIEDGVLQMISATWKKVMAFWGAALAAISGALLFALRRKLAVWTGRSNARRQLARPGAKV
jgi:hypothetical protein